MQGTFEITEVLETTPKYSVMVSFNGNTPEYYEAELTKQLPSEITSQFTEESTEAERMDILLQHVADKALNNT